MSNKKHRDNIISIPLNNHLSVDRAVREDLVFDYKGQQFKLLTVTEDRGPREIDSLTIKLNKIK